MDEVLTREDVVAKLEEYLRHRTTLVELIDWAEDAMREADFEHAHFDAIRDVVARLGVADVRAFGLTWEDCEQALNRLGYAARVELTEVR